MLTYACLLQNGAQRMQAQQQAAAAKQAEMQQQLGAAMMASYPGYMLAPYGMVRSMLCDGLSYWYCQSWTGPLRMSACLRFAAVSSPCANYIAAWPRASPWKMSCL